MPVDGLLIDESGPWCTGRCPGGVFWLRTREMKAAETSPTGLVEVWSTIRLLMTRGCKIKHEARTLLLL